MFIFNIARRSVFTGLIILLVLLTSCAKHGERMFRKSDFVMDTIVAITVVSDDPSRAEMVIDEGFSELRRLEKLLSFFSGESEISRINKNAGIKPVKVSADTLRVIKKAVEVSRMSGGAFDITVGPVTGLYDFKEKRLPGDDELERALKLVGYKNIIIDEDRGTVFLKNRGMKIDTGGIAKGYGADRVVELLKKRGIKAALVAVAGDIRCYGRRPDGKPWRVGVKDPMKTGDAILGVLPLTDSAISTSGDYERFFIKDGMRYHHLIDPRTGRPAHGLKSVTVLAPEGVLTDSYATAAFVLGLEEGRRLLEKLGFQYIMVDEGGKLHVSKGLKDHLETV
ncbi:MAG: FAD:protein FMN transferase [Nitrospirae bacterium]|nr:MAG: FAD:protein FMN transferase [Nitrospirota bacterium]